MTFILRAASSAFFLAKLMSEFEERTTPILLPFLEIGLPNMLPYVASRGGIKQLGKALAYDLGKYNTRVNNIGPGYIYTKMTSLSLKMSSSLALSIIWTGKTSMTSVQTG